MSIKNKQDIVNIFKKILIAFGILSILLVLNEYVEGTPQQLLNYLTFIVVTVINIK